MTFVTFIYNICGANDIYTMCDIFMNLYDIWDNYDISLVMCHFYAIHDISLWY